MGNYTKYRASDINWLGRVPQHWKETKLKYVGFLYSGLTGKKGEDFSAIPDLSTRPFIPFVNIVNNENIDISNLQYVRLSEAEEQNDVKRGDLFFMMSSENFEDIGKTAVLVDDMDEVYLNSFCKGFRIIDDNVDPLFLNYLLRCHSYRKRLMIEANGFTRINLKTGKVNDLKICIPPTTDEQIQIANYLQHKTIQLDKLVSDKQNLISLLREERVAIINQAITKGINPTAPMKDSGISWLGEIPEHWTVGKLKYLCELITDGSHYSPITLEVGKRYISVKDVKDNTVDFSDCKYISAHDFAQLERNGCRPKKDDILLTKDGTIGRAAIVSDDNDFVILSSLAIIRPFKEKVHFEYLKYFLLSSINIDQMLSSLQGSALTRITLTIINNLLTVIPPIDEQLAILSYIKIKEQQLDKLFIREEREIELLKEYKVALISEVVTGKVDVRNEVLTELTELAL